MCEYNKKKLQHLITQKKITFFNQAKKTLIRVISNSTSLFAKVELTLYALERRFLQESRVLRGLVAYLRLIYFVTFRVLL